MHIPVNVKMHNTHICRILGGIASEDIGAKTHAKANESSNVEVTLDTGNCLRQFLHRWVDVAVW